MQSDKSARLAKWRRTLGTLCITYVMVLLVLKAPAGLAVAKHVWLLYLVKLQSRCAHEHRVPSIPQLCVPVSSALTGGLHLQASAR